MLNLPPAGLPEEILHELYPRLRRMAAARMAAGGPGQTLQPTALVHEAWLRLSGSGDSSWRDPSHFCAAVAGAMRHVLIDRARQRSRIKRWGDHQRVPMSEANDKAVTNDEKTLLINEALERLAEIHPLRAKLVLLKFFGGLSNREISREMAMTERTVERHWTYARSWLYREIRPNL